MKNWLKRLAIFWSLPERVKVLEDTAIGAFPQRWPEGAIRLSDRQFEKITERLVGEFSISVQELRQDVDTLKLQPLKVGADRIEALISKVMDLSAPPSASNKRIVKQAAKGKCRK